MKVPFPLTNTLWLLAAGLFAGHQLLQYGLAINVSALDNYLDPFLSVPILLGGVLLERTWLFGQRRFTLLETVIATVLIGLVSEILFPALNDRFVYDTLDFVAIALGCVYFWLLINPAVSGARTRDAVG